MATELATSLWSDTMHLTLVGAGEDLAVLAPDRVHVAGSVAKALPLLEAHAAGVADALAASDARSVLAGRAEGLIPEAWTPHYLITLIPPTPQEAGRLAALGRAGALAAGYLVAGEAPGAIWTWEVTPDGQLRAPELGLDVTAQLIPAGQRGAMVGLFDAADDMDGSADVRAAGGRGTGPAPGPRRHDAGRGHPARPGVRARHRGDRAQHAAPRHGDRGLLGDPPRGGTPERAGQGDLAAGRRRRDQGRRA